MPQSARDLGEFDLVDRLLSRLTTSRWKVDIGPGDDAAAVELYGRHVLATADLLLEGVHFDLALSSPADVGWKALAVNLSDIAAMGGEPRFALVSLGAPADAPLAVLEELYDGLDECAGSFHTPVVGGDTVRSERLIVSVTVVGEWAVDAVPIRRGGASVGDVLCVTGRLGGAAAGLKLLRAAAAGDGAAAELLERFPNLAAAHRRPVPRIREGQAAAAAGAAAMIDVSDGLGQDVDHITFASGTGARVIRSTVPLADGVTEAAQWAGIDPVGLAVGGGDDYELVLALKTDDLDAVTEAVAPTPVTRIGDITHGDRARLVDGSVAVDLFRSGWDQFKDDA